MQRTLEHSSQYVYEFEKDDLDVSTVYDQLGDYCDYYINRLVKFEHLGVQRLEIMNSIVTNEFKSKFMMDEEFEEDFKGSFQELDLDMLNRKKRNYSFKISARHYNFQRS